MNSTPEETPIVVMLPVAEAADTPESPRMADIRTVFLGGIFIILLMTILKVASEIVVPVVLACVLKLVLHPVMRRVEKFRVPRHLAAVIILIGFFGSIVALGVALSTPASNWAERAPQSISQVKERLNFIKKPVENTQKILGQAEDLTKTEGQKVMPVAVQGTRLSDRIFSGTQAFASGLFTTILVLFFLLAAGDTFLRRTVEILPRFKDKRQAVDISQRIENDISAYLLTITTMNAVVGISTGIIMWACGIGDALLWGTLAFLLNYVPVIGPIICLMLFSAISMLAMPTAWDALQPVALYMIVHVIEGSFVTPMLLAKRFTLNPVLVIMSLVFWYWMWGFAGAILAVPMLAIFKIICDNIQSLNALGHFLEGDKKPLAETKA